MPNETKTLELPQSLLLCQKWDFSRNAVTVVERLLHRKLWMYSSDSRIWTVFGWADFSLNKIKISVALYQDMDRLLSPMERVGFRKSLQGGGTGSGLQLSREILQVEPEVWSNACSQLLNVRMSRPCLGRKSLHISPSSKLVGNYVAENSSKESNLDVWERELSDRLYELEKSKKLANTEIVKIQKLDRSPQPSPVFVLNTASLHTAEAVNADSAL